MGKSKEIKQKWKGPNYFDIYFFVIFTYYNQIFISKRETLPPSSIKIFLILTSFLKS